ncbi:hypothetical protein GCM10009665_59070 [Kitasatospora nipponensis]|uniref:DDE family transposase n=1 Tax=Kitasatospora nipponensis TaxID=258049 RepID=A0ABP4HDZ5_9ACTN
MRILRHRTDLTTGRVSRQTVYAITDLTSQQASPQQLGQLTRAPWIAENQLHFVRDTTFAAPKAHRSSPGCSRRAERRAETREPGETAEKTTPI